MKALSFKLSVYDYSLQWFWAAWICNMWKSWSCLIDAAILVFLVSLIVDACIFHGSVFLFPLCMNFWSSIFTSFLAVDIISAIEFDKSGDHLATGDRGGRVVLFERTDTKDVCLLECPLCLVPLDMFLAFCVH